MKKIECWPPPDWVEVIVTWDDMLTGHYTRDLLDWIDMVPGGNYHLHGYKSTEGFAFRFEDPKDALCFMLKWC